MIYAELPKGHCCVGICNHLSQIQIRVYTKNINHISIRTAQKRAKVIYVLLQLECNCRTKSNSLSIKNGTVYMKIILVLISIGNLSLQKYNTIHNQKYFTSVGILKSKTAQNYQPYFGNGQGNILYFLTNTHYLFMLLFIFLFSRIRPETMTNLINEVESSWLRNSGS